MTTHIQYIIYMPFLRFQPRFLQAMSLYILLRWWISSSIFFVKSPRLSPDLWNKPHILEFNTNVFCVCDILPWLSLLFQGMHWKNSWVRCAGCHIERMVLNMELVYIVSLVASSVRYTLRISSVYICIQGEYYPIL